MELTNFIRKLWRCRVPLAIVQIVAIVVAIQLGYHVSLSGIKAKTTPSGAATAQILVDSPSSALANLKQNPLPLSTRAGVFAQFMASTVVRDAIARQTGLPPQAILAQGPFDDPALAPSGSTVPKPPDAGSITRGRRYRISFVAQEQLPVVTVYAQAPDVKTAARLANAVAPAVRTYIDRLQAAANLDVRYRTQIRSLGPAQAGTVSQFPAQPLVLMGYIVVVLLGAVPILMLDTYRQRRNELADPAADGFELIEVDDEDEDEDEDDPDAEPVRPARSRGRRRRRSADDDDDDQGVSAVIQSIGGQKKPTWPG